MRRRAVLTAFVAIISLIFFVIFRLAVVRPLAYSVNVRTLSLNNDKIFSILRVNNKIYGDNNFSVFELNNDYSVKKVLWSSNDIVDDSEIPLVHTGSYLLKVATFKGSSLTGKQKLIEINMNSNTVSEFPIPENCFVEPYMSGPNFQRQIFASDGFLFVNAGRKLLVFNCKTGRFKIFALPGYLKSFCIGKYEGNGNSSGKIFVYGIDQAGDFDAFLLGILNIRNDRAYNFDYRIYWLDNQNYVLDSWRILPYALNSGKLVIIDNFMSKFPLLHYFDMQSAYDNNGILSLQTLRMCYGKLKSGIIYSADAIYSGNIVLASGYSKTKELYSTELIIFDLSKHKNFPFLKKNVCKIIDLNGKILTLAKLGESNGKMSFIAVGENHIYELSVSSVHR